ncbi:MAG: hypothetical protein ACRCYO_17250 [Bacteroidia bacterium]
MSYTNADCIKALTEKGLAPICGDYPNAPNGSTYCRNWIIDNPGYHNFCSGPYLYTPAQAIICKNSATGETLVFPQPDLIKDCTQLHDQDSNWNLSVCYCCCSGSGGFSATIASPTGDLAVHTLQTGNAVHAGTLQGTTMKWTTQALSLSAGLNSSEAADVITLVVNGSTKLSVTPDHVLMLANGKLVLAQALKISDLLMRADGEVAKITALGLEHLEHAIHSISTDAPFDGTPNGHLITTNGIVNGDYTLQINFDKLPSSFKA